MRARGKKGRILSGKISSYIYNVILWYNACKLSKHALHAYIVCIRNEGVEPSEFEPNSISEKN